MMQVPLSIVALAALAIASGAGLFWASVRLYRNRLWLPIVGVAIPLGTIWVLFVAGSLLESIPSIQDWSHGYAPTELGVLALISGLTVIGVAAYSVLFNWAKRITSGVISPVTAMNRPKKVAIATLLPVLVVDLYGRVQSIAAGTYFRWIAPLYEESYTAAVSDPIYLILGTTGYTVLALFMYLRTKAERRGKRWLINGCIIGQSALLVGRGSRKDVFFILAIIGLVVGIEYSQRRRFRKTRSLGRRIMLVASGVLLLWFGITVVPTARLGLRAAITAQSNDPADVVQTYLFEEVPKQALNLGDEEKGYSPLRDLAGRIASYPAFASAIAERQVRAGQSPTGLSGVGGSVEYAIPSFLISGTKIRPNDIFHRHYPQLVMDQDPHGHPLTSGIVHLGLIGIVTVLVIGGIITGVLLGGLQPFKGLGVYVAVGLIPTIIPLGTGLGSYLASLRNALLVVIVLYLCNALVRMKV